MNIFRYNRIMIIGNNGSGKSFLSKELSTITNLPLIHLDKEYWRPNWSKPEKDEWINKQRKFISNKKWIIDGNHTDTMELRFKAADIIIFLDINRFLCLVSIILRCGKKRSDLPHYLDEKFDRGFLRLSRGLWSFSKTRKLAIMDLHNKYPDKQFFVIKSRKKVNKLLNIWRNETKNINY